MRATPELGHERRGKETLDRTHTACVWYDKTLVDTEDVIRVIRKAGATQLNRLRPVHGMW